LAWLRTQSDFLCNSAHSTKHHTYMFR